MIEATIFIIASLIVALIYLKIRGKSIISEMKELSGKKTVRIVFQLDDSIVDGSLVEFQGQNIIVNVNGTLHKINVETINYYY